MQSSLNLGIDKNGKMVSIEDDEEEKSVVGFVDERVTCPVCGVKVSGQNDLINSHLGIFFVLLFCPFSLCYFSNSLSVLQRIMARQR